VCDVSTTLIIRMRTAVVVPQEPPPRDGAAPIVLGNNSSGSSSGVGSDGGGGVGGATPSTVLVVGMINISSNKIVIVAGTEASVMLPMYGRIGIKSCLILSASNNDVDLNTFIFLVLIYHHLCNNFYSKVIVFNNRFLSNLTIICKQYGHQGL